MLLASYRSTRQMPMGLANVLIRFRLKGRLSHSEVVFQPGDGADRFMPDGTCLPDETGALWCFSSVAVERLPPWSSKRAGRVGGARFKRILLTPDKWLLRQAPYCPIRAAQRAREMEGQMYDWRQIFGFLVWWIPQQDARASCAEACANAFGFGDPWRFDPCSLDAAVRAF